MKNSEVLIMWTMLVCVLLMWQIASVTCYGGCGGGYSVVPDLLTQEEAALHCRQRGFLGLATIRSPQEEQAARLALEEKLREDNSAEFWIGLKNNGSRHDWVWPDGSKAVLGAWVPWEEGNRRDWDSEPCLRIVPSLDYKWRTIFCNHKFYPLCQRGSTSEFRAFSPRLLKLVDGDVELAATQEPSRAACAGQCRCLDPWCNAFRHGNGTCQLFSLKPGSARDSGSLQTYWLADSFSSAS